MFGPFLCGNGLPTLCCPVSLGSPFGCWWLYVSQKCHRNQLAASIHVLCVVAEEQMVWEVCVHLFLQMLLNVHRDQWEILGTGSPGWQPWLAHSSWALIKSVFLFLSVTFCWVDSITICLPHHCMNCNMLCNGLCSSWRCLIFVDLNNCDFHQEFTSV